VGILILEPHEFNILCIEDANKIAKERANSRCEICGKVGRLGLVICHHKIPLRKERRALNLL